MFRNIIVLLSILCIALPLSVSAQIYQGSGYTIDLLGKKWEHTPPDSESIETYSLSSRLIQVFPADADVYTVMSSRNKKDISYIFQTYKYSVGSTDMSKEQSRKTKDGILHFATYSVYNSQSDERFYGAFCIVSDTALKSSRMVNIIDVSRAIKPAEAIKICSSIRSVSPQTDTSKN